MFFTKPAHFLKPQNLNPKETKKSIITENNQPSRHSPRNIREPKILHRHERNLITNQFSDPNHNFKNINLPVQVKHQESQVTISFLHTGH